jgi:multiple inositol-polyphosphate phosphatase / 2,3-bisphosphoglycerate 3-phosphatase
MKKILLFLVLSSLIYSASAQNCADEFLGTKTLYKDAIKKYTPAPAGYSPVFINHVGRHGARHLTKDVKTTFAYTLLLAADSVGDLTEKGKSLKQMVLALQKVEKGNTKSISAEGATELKGIGERMYTNYPGVFKGRPNLNIAITKEIRTKQSADAFLQGLNARLKDTAATNEYNNDTDLRFYDLSAAYKSFEKSAGNSNIKLSLEKAEHFNEINNAVISRFFKPTLLDKLNDDDRKKFVSDVFGFATIVYSLNAEKKHAGFTPENLDFKSFFTCDELEKLSILDSADEYLKKGPGTDLNGIQVRVAVPLLVNFINTADEFVKTGKFNAQLRFAHAETISPFAALLQISTADKATNDFSKLNTVWKSSAIIPLSANIQWIFYKKKGTAEYLVKVLLNEKEISITGLKARSLSYYKWNDLRDFYITKLIKLNVKLTDNMELYLANLK